MSALAEDVLQIIKETQHRALIEPEWFYRELVRCEELLPWQLEGIEAALDVPRLAFGYETHINHKGLQTISIVSGHGTGKTHFLALLNVIWNYCFPALSVVTAPKYDQVRTRFFPRYRAILRNAVYREHIKIDTMKAAYYGDIDWGVQGETASEPENIAGYHDTPQLIGVDEASSQRLDDLYQTLEGALTTPGSVVAEIGNPTRSTGEFWSHHNKPKVAELCYRMHVNYTHARKIVSMAWVNKMKKKYGKDSPVFKVRVLGEFVKAEKFQLLHYSWLANAADRDFKDDGSIPRLVVSVDVADGGDDFTVVTAALFYETVTLLLRQEKHSFDPEDASLKSGEAGMEMFDRFDGKKNGEDSLIIDAVGPGSGSCGIAQREGYPVVRYKGGESSDNSSEWRNRRVQSYISLRDDFRDNKIIIAEDFVDDEDDLDEFFDQLASIRLRQNTERNEDLETKEQHNKRTKKSPDRADSAAQLYSTQVPTIYEGDVTVTVVGESLEDNYDAGLI